MKHQALFSSKEKVKTWNVVCCNFCLALNSQDRVKHDSFRVFNAFVTRFSCVCMKRALKRVDSRFFALQTRFPTANQIGITVTRKKRVWPRFRAENINQSETFICVYQWRRKRENRESVLANQELDFAFLTIYAFGWLFISWNYLICERFHFFVIGWIN